MSILSILEGTDWLAAVEKATTNSTALLPLLIKTALDGAKVGSGDPAALMALLSDIEKDIAATTTLFTANNTEATPSAGAGA